MRSYGANPKDPVNTPVIETGCHRFFLSRNRQKPENAAKKKAGFSDPWDHTILDSLLKSTLDLCPDVKDDLNILCIYPVNVCNVLRYMLQK